MNIFIKIIKYSIFLMICTTIANESKLPSFPKTSSPDTMPVINIMLSSLRTENTGQLISPSCDLYQNNKLKEMSCEELLKNIKFPYNPKFENINEVHLIKNEIISFINKKDSHSIYDINAILNELDKMKKSFENPYLFTNSVVVYRGLIGVVELINIIKSKRLRYDPNNNDDNYPIIKNYEEFIKIAKNHVKNAEAYVQFHKMIQTPTVSTTLSAAIAKNFARGENNKKIWAEIRLKYPKYCYNATNGNEEEMTFPFDTEVIGIIPHIKN